MQTFLILFRETDRREQVPSPEWTERHQLAWKQWLDQQAASGTLKGGRALSMEGRVITVTGEVLPGPHFNGDEMVGGYLLLEATDLEAATAITRSCPVFAAGGFAEVRPLM